MKKYLLVIGLALLQTTFSMARDHSPGQNCGFEKEGYTSQDSSKEFTDTSDLVGVRNSKQLQADMMQRDDVYNKDDSYDNNSKRWGRKRSDNELNNGMNGNDCCAPTPKKTPCCPKPKPKCCKPKCCPKPKASCCPKPKCCKPKCSKPSCKSCEPKRQPACTKDGCCMPTREPSCTINGCCEPTRLMQYEKPKCCKQKTPCKRPSKCCDDKTTMDESNYRDNKGNYRDNRNNMMRDRSNTTNTRDRNTPRDM